MALRALADSLPTLTTLTLARRSSSTMKYYEDLPLIGRKDSGHISGQEYTQLVASRILYSPSCGAFYLSLLAASLTEIV